MASMRPPRLWRWNAATRSRSFTSGSATGSRSTPSSRSTHPTARAASTGSSTLLYRIDKRDLSAPRPVVDLTTQQMIIPNPSTPMAARPGAEEWAGNHFPIVPRGIKPRVAGAEPKAVPRKQRPSLRGTLPLSPATRCGYREMSSGLIPECFVELPASASGDLDRFAPVTSAGSTSAGDRSGPCTCRTGCTTAPARGSCRPPT